MREDMAGKRGKCPKCSQPIDFAAAKGQAAQSASQKAPSPAATDSTLTTDQIASTVRDAISGIPIKAPGNATTAALVCTLARGLHYLLPVVLGGALAWHVLMNGGWASGAS